MKRRRKTPENALSTRLRTYAAQYAARGQKERAEGLLQAADLIDDHFAHAGAPRAPVDMDPAARIHARVRDLEIAVARLLGEEDRPSAKPSAVVEPIDGGKGRRPRVSKAGPLLNAEPSPAAGPNGAVALNKGEMRLLSACAYRVEGFAFHELAALTDYRATSLHTYLGNLQAARLIEKTDGRYVATTQGGQLASPGIISEPGLPLYHWWVEHLPRGEATILTAIEKRGRATARDLVGDETGLKATSVHTYLGHLRRRKLVVHDGKFYTLAPILTPAFR